ncbi:MAG: septum site-determining protein MinC, partial [Rhodanobacteraceae bacterium]
AHAGAQGDARAAVYALVLAATQLRIAAVIAAEDGESRASPAGPEAAYVKDDRIVIVPHDRVEHYRTEGVSFT